MRSPDTGRRHASRSELELHLFPIKADSNKSGKIRRSIRPSLRALLRDNLKKGGHAAPLVIRCGKELGLLFEALAFKHDSCAWSIWIRAADSQMINDFSLVCG